MHAAATMAGGGSSDGRQSALPYHIPGPAGFGFGQAGARTGVDATASQAVRHETRERARPFDTRAWHALLRACSLRPYGSGVLSSSVALVQSEALRQEAIETARLAVRVEKMSWAGKDAVVTLADPTGSIGGTVLCEVFSDRKCVIEEGSVLLLKNVTVQYYRDRSQKGFHADETVELQVSVRRKNIERIFGEVDEGPELPRKEGVLPYSENALKPPKVNKKAIRRLSLPTPVRPGSRAPSRGHPQHQGRPQASPPANNYGGGPYGGGRPGNQWSTPQRTPPVPRQGLHPPPTPVSRPNVSLSFWFFLFALTEHRLLTNAFFFVFSILQSNSHNLPQHQQPFKRPGSRPLQSARPAQRPRYQASPAHASGPQSPFVPTQPTVPTQPAVPAQNTAADTMTDDQLDSLLGNVDIDAVIAAATQTQSATQTHAPAEAIIDVDAGDDAVPSADSLAIAGSPSPSPGVSQVQVRPPPPLPRSGRRATAGGGASQGSNEVTPQPASQPEASITAGQAAPNTSGAPAPNAESVGKSTEIGAMDDSMLDSLLDGLDDDDFV